MACAHMEVVEEDRSKRFKQAVQAPLADAGPVPYYSQGIGVLSQQVTGPDASQQPGSGAAAGTEPAAGGGPPASSAPQGSTLARPAASQQYPVLPQAAASAAAAAASTLQGLAAAPQQWMPSASDPFASIAKKHSQAADLQQQRRRAGPVNQWRPGMPLLGGAQQQQQQQGYPPLLAAPQQKQLGPYSTYTAHQQQQYQQVRPSGAAAAGSAGYQALPGGALAAALQTLLPRPCQLLAAQQMSAAAVLHSTPQLQQPPSESQQAMQILAGALTGPPAVAPGRPASAPHASLDRPPAAAAAAAGGSAGAAIPTAPQPAPQPAAGVMTPGSAGLAAAGAAGVAPSGSADWLKLLSCAVDPQGDSLALELLLGGQLYKGQLTRVTPAQAPEAPAAVAAAATHAAAPGVLVKQEPQQQQQQQEEEEQEPQVLSVSEQATLLEFAQQREGMCFLCALPLSLPVPQSLKQEGVIKQEGGAGPSLQAPSQDAGPAVAATAPTAALDPGAPEAAGQEGPSTQQAEEQQQQQGATIPPEEPQQGSTPDHHQQQGGLMGSLGPAVRCDLGSGCCLSLHQACAAASAKASAWQQQEPQAGESPSAQQLLECLSRHCCGCDQRAATLPCAAPGCSRWFHVPCVQGMGACQLQDGSCWCSEHQELMKQQQQSRAAGPFAAAASTTDAAAALAAAGLSSPEPSQAAGINPSPSFAAALVLQQMRCSKGYDVLLLGPDAEAAAGSNSGSGSAGRGLALGQTHSSAQRRLLEAMPVSNSSNNSSAAAGRGQGQSGAGLYGSTAEASRQYHLQQQQLGALGAQAAGVSGPGPATTMLLQRLQQQTAGGTASSWQQQQQQVGPTRRSPKSAKGRPPLHAPPGKSKGAWNSLGLISAFALAQQQQEALQEQQHQQQLAASHAAAAAVAASGPTVVVPRVRARKGATQPMVQ